MAPGQAAAGRQGLEKSQAGRDRSQHAPALQQPLAGARTRALRPGPMSYLILGANGMLGRALRELLTREGRTFLGLDLPAFDLTNPEHLAAALETKYDAVINCAAY